MDASQLIARYGKMAYTWNLHEPGCPMIRQIPLPSSRGHIATSPCQTFLAVTNVSSSYEKGIIDVWQQHHQNDQSNLSGNINYNSYHTARGTIATASSTRIDAHPKQVVRGLQFVATGSSNMVSEGHHWLVSASLQGEVKFWKYHPSATPESSSIRGGFSGSYSCTHIFQSSGKIFSMSCTSSDDLKRMYLAVGQSRGQVRVWKVNLLDEHFTPQTNASKSKEDQKIVESRLQPSMENQGSSSNDILQEFLSTEVGEHMHHDNIKLLCFTPDIRSLVVSRAYDGRIWFHTFRH
jgi:WD40 repeat protein